MSATATAPEGEEMCLQLPELDRELGDFLAFLDGRGIDYAVALTADHGGLDIPERLQTAGVTDACTCGSRAERLRRWARALVKQLGLRGPACSDGTVSGDIWIDARLSPADRTRLLNAAVAAYKAHPQVEAVYTAQADRRDAAAKRRARTNGRCSSVLRASYSSGPLGRLPRRPQARRDADRRHDALRCNPRQPWDYDRRVPVVFWRKGHGAGRRRATPSRRWTSCRRSPR